MCSPKNNTVMAFCQNILSALQSATMPKYGKPKRLSDCQLKTAIQVLRFMRAHGWLSREDARWALSQGIQL